MNILLFILGIIAVLIWHRFSMKKIDEEEALKAPGKATFIRNNFSGFISNVLEDTNNYIVFERTDQIRFGKKGQKDYKLICGNMMDSDGPVLNVIIQSGATVLYEKKFKKGTDTSLISKEVLSKF